MNVLQKHIVNAMPYARRYARALTGDSNLADLTLTQASNIVLRRAPLVTFFIPYKIVLPWLLIEFHRQLDSSSLGFPNTAAIEGSESDPFREEPLYEKIDLALQSLSELQRRVFLLTTLERFRASTISRILSIQVDDVKLQFHQAHIIVTECLAESTCAHAA